MKRIAFLVCGLLLIVGVNSAEARRGRGGNNYQPTYAQPSYAQPVVVQKPVVTLAPAKAETTAAAADIKSETKSVKVTPVSVSATTTTAKATMKNAFDTSTAQGVANIMASRGYVGHFGGNPGYEGCGMASTKEGAYSICCYANSGMATVDVGYAQAPNGYWYCCRRYR